MGMAREQQGQYARLDATIAAKVKEPCDDG